MSSNLVIVESPAKAKTIEKFLGKDFKVMSSFGHVRDLPKNNQAIDIENNFTPTYVINDDKKKVISELKRAAKNSQMIWLASDEDREGEAIAWHLEQALDLSEDKTKRIVFHEITKPAILNAVANPRQIDRNLVNGQQARRVLDRLVGFELSPVLWKKIQAGLSAGRVQSVAVRLVVEREREIEAHSSTSSFKISFELATENKEVFTAKLPKDKKTIEEVEEYLNRVKQKTLTVESIKQSPGKRSAKPPFTTSTLQQAASLALGFSVRQTMMLAQKLYESGKITYMRTDSFNLANTALQQAQAYITQRFGEQYHQRKVYRSKSANAQEAHEAIRPTDLTKSTVRADKNEQRLYDLIWRRTLASQMSDVQLQRTTVNIAIADEEERLQAKGEVITFDGFLKVMGKSKQDANIILPNLTENQALTIQDLKAQESFSRPPSRFTEASLVKTLEELGIGRPSTYAPTISTIQNRGYVEKGFDEGKQRNVRILVLRQNKIIREDKTEMTGSNKGKLVPSDIAGIVTDFLVKHFSEVVDYNFTAKVEKQFDEIALGNLAWQQMIGDFYQPFHQDIVNAENISRDDVNQARQLGIDPKSGKPVSVRTGRFGLFAQIGTRDDEEKPKFASLKPEHRLALVTLEEVLPLFDLPRNLGELASGETVIVNSGRFGPYTQYIDKSVQTYLEQNNIKGIDLVPQNTSIGDLDPYTISFEDTVSLINDKKQADAKKEIKLFVNSPVQILDGRWGPFVTDGFKNAKVPKDVAAKDLSLKQCLELLQKTKNSKKRLNKTYYGGGYTLLREPKSFPTVILKVKENKEKLANEIAQKLELDNKFVRLISARGAALIKASENRKKK